MQGVVHVARRRGRKKNNKDSHFRPGRFGGRNALYFETLLLRIIALRGAKDNWSARRVDRANGSGPRRLFDLQNNLLGGTPGKTRASSV